MVPIDFEQNRALDASSVQVSRSSRRVDMARADTSFFAGSALAQEVGVWSAPTGVGPGRPCQVHVVFRRLQGSRLVGPLATFGAIAPVVGLEIRPEANFVGNTGLLPGADHPFKIPYG